MTSTEDAIATLLALFILVFTVASACAIPFIGMAYIVGLLT